MTLDIQKSSWGKVEHPGCKKTGSCCAMNLSTPSKKFDSSMFLRWSFCHFRSKKICQGRIETICPFGLCIQYWRWPTPPPRSPALNRSLHLSARPMGTERAPHHLLFWVRSCREAIIANHIEDAKGYLEPWLWELADDRETWVGWTARDIYLVAGSRNWSLSFVQ